MTSLSLSPNQSWIWWSATSSGNWSTCSHSKDTRNCKFNPSVLVLMYFICVVHCALTCPLWTLTFSWYSFGAEGYIVARPKFYDILRRQVPQERLHMGKKVLSMDQGGNGVLLRFSDGTEAEGDILVGADGAYSAVRQGLYEKLKKEKRLPPGDGTPLPFSTVCLVGQTRPLTAEEFPDIELPDCQFRTTVGTNRPFAVSRCFFLLTSD